jgi:hypothetical protein
VRGEDCLLEKGGRRKAVGKVKGDEGDREDKGHWPNLPISATVPQLSKLSLVTGL